MAILAFLFYAAVVVASYFYARRSTARKSHKVFSRVLAMLLPFFVMSAFPELIGTVFLVASIAWFIGGLVWVGNAVNE